MFWVYLAYPLLWDVCLSCEQEQYPKSKIEVFVSVVEDGGGLLAACVTAASLALCDANINMYDVVVATSLVSTVLGVTIDLFIYL